MNLRLLVVPAALALTACSTCGALDSKMGKIKPGMTPDEVKTLLGQPTRIDHSETAGAQGDVYLYPTSGGEGRVVFFNSSVFKIEIVPGTKT